MPGWDFSRRPFRRAALVALAWTGACGSARKQLPARGELPALEELPAPSWRVVARRDGKVLLAANRVIVRGISRRDDRTRERSAERAAEYPTLIFEHGRVRNGPTARADLLALGAGAARDTLRVYSLEFEGRPVLFAQTGEAPALYESPTEPGLYVVGRSDHLWLVTPTGATRLTADTVRGIARDTLRAQQREGVRYLIWTAAPLWRPDGSGVAYVTNRTWMSHSAGGQEVWLADVHGRRERPVLSERGEFFLPAGWLGPELVYGAREGAISAVDVRTGSRRTIAPGSAEAVSPMPPRVLYMTSVGDIVRGHVLTERGVVDIPDPPLGERLAYGGSFSPSGDRLLLGTTFARDSGITRALYLFELGAKRLTPLMQWSVREGTRHPLGLGRLGTAWLDDSTLLLTRFDRRTGLESSTLLRLGGAP